MLSQKLLVVIRNGAHGPTQMISRRVRVLPQARCQFPTTAVILMDTSTFGNSTPSLPTARAGGSVGKNFAVFACGGSWTMFSGLRMILPAS